MYACGCTYICMHCLFTVNTFDISTQTYTHMYTCWFLVHMYVCLYVKIVCICLVWWEQQNGFLVYVYVNVNKVCVCVLSAAVYEHSDMCIHTSHACTQRHMHVHNGIYMHTCCAVVRVYMYVYECVHGCFLRNIHRYAHNMYTHTCVHMAVAHNYTCIYIYIYIYIYISCKCDNICPTCMHAHTQHVQL
jgi:hypothetical protein